MESELALLAILAFQLVLTARRTSITWDCRGGIFNVIRSNGIAANCFTAPAGG